MEAEQRAECPALRILSAEPISREGLLSALRHTRLVGFDRAEPYAHAQLELAPATDTERLAPAQRYVLRRGVAKILALRTALLAHGLDVFALDGGAYVRTSHAPGEAVPVLPPIVEESREPDGRTVLIVNDGIHRVFAARSLGLPITTVIARRLPAEYPYYALALPGGWNDVVELDELPDNFLEKAYRDPVNPRALYRDFNEQFPGVQAQRKDSNPGDVRG